MSAFHHTWFGYWCKHVSQSASVYTARYVHTYVRTCTACAGGLTQSQSQHANPLQSEIGFRVTDAKKGVSVFWDLPRLEERLEQMRELYQVRPASATPITSYHQHHAVCSLRAQHCTSICDNTHAPACVRVCRQTVHDTSGLHVQYVYVIVMHSGSFGWGFLHPHLC